ncbi:hypothetical protein [Streptomyces sp. PsTaAH-124]|nr:hypothetical protein [Streptomyces sp. PsTaAH-124]
MKRACATTLVAAAATATLAVGAGSAAASAATPQGSGEYVNTFVVQYWSALGDPWGICRSDAARSNAEEGRNPDGSIKYYCADAGNGDVNMWKRHLA